MSEKKSLNLIVLGIVLITLGFAALSTLGGCSPAQKITVIKHPLQKVDNEATVSDGDTTPEEAWETPPAIKPRTITLRCPTCKWFDGRVWQSCQHQPNFRLLIMHLERRGH